MDNNEHKTTNEAAPLEVRVEETVVALDGIKKSRDWFLPVSILIAAVLISGSIIWAVGYANRPAAKQADLAGANAPTASIPPVGGRDVILGDAKAPVTFIEYGDYQCPFCHKFFNQYEPQIRDQYIKTGKVKMIYRNYMVVDTLVRQGGSTPAQKTENESHLAAMAGECAKDQNKFWAFHDAVMTDETKDGKEGNGDMDRAFFVRAASEAGLEANAFAQCYDSGKYAKTVQDEADAAAKAGVSGTPSFFVNGAQVRDPLQAIDQALGNS